MAKDDFPTPILHPEKLMPLNDFGAELQIGGIWGSVKSGETWRAADGRRFIWYVDGMQVVYSIDGKFLTQSARGFKGDIRTYPIVAAGVSAAPWVVVAQTEMKLLMGIVAGASWAGFALVIGMEVTEFLAENGPEFRNWERQLETALKVRAMLKEKTPVLYDKVFTAVLSQVWKDVKSNLPDAITPQVVFFGIGVIIGAAGKAAAKGKFSWVGVLVVVLEQLLIRFTTGVAPQAIKITANEYQKMAKEIISQLQTAGVTLQDADLKKITEEVRNNPQLVKDAFKMLQDSMRDASDTKSQAVAN